MPNLNYAEVKFRLVLKELQPFWWRIAYLIPDVVRRHTDIQDGLLNVLKDKDSEFHKFVTGQVQAYITKGVMPHENIAASIINISEDILAGRNPEIRGGDYIAIMNHMQR